MRRSHVYLARFRDFLRFGKRKEEAGSSVDDEQPDEFDEIDERTQSEQLDELKARGVLKYKKNYNPPANVEPKLVEILDKILSANGTSLPKKPEQSAQFRFSDKNVKFRLLAAAEQAFGKPVPNSKLHELKSLRDVIEYYQVPVTNVTDYVQTARRNNLPKNVHIVEEPKRFHPQDGVETAYPGRSSYVTDLRERQFNVGFRAKSEWHHYADKHFDYTAPPPDCPWSKPKADRADKIMQANIPEF